MTIHKEGYPTLIWVAAVLVPLNAYGWMSTWPEMIQVSISLLSGLFFLFFLQFFRSPRVHLEAAEYLVYAPAEGKVVSIQEVTEPECLKKTCIQLSIFMSPFNVHINRSPFTGEVEYFRYHRGKYLVAYHPKSSTANERTSILLRNSTGHKVLVRQIAGLVARRIRCYVKEGSQLKAGAEFGFIKFGSRVDLFLPLGTRILVEPGARTSAGKTILAALPS